MSDGLKLLASIVDTASVHLLRENDRSLFLNDELVLYDFLSSHYRRYGQLPAIATVEEELGIDMPVANEVPEFYVQKVNDRKMYGLVRVQYQALKDAMRENDMVAVRAVIDDMKTATRVVRSAGDVRTIREGAEEVIRRYEQARLNPGVTGVPTGWPTMDDDTGGYQPADLVSFIARPAMGKTFLMLRQALSAWEMGYSVLVVTMEMSIEQITRRSIAMGAGINPKYMRKGMLSRYAERRLRDYVGNMAGSRRYRMFSGGLKKKVVDVELLVHEFQPDIVFIDGVYLMQSERTARGGNRTDTASSVFDELKQLTLAVDRPVIVTSQYSRQAGKKGKDGSLENVAYTDAISTHSSLVISIGEGPAPRQTSQRTLSYLKGREGESAPLVVDYVFSPMRFSEAQQVAGETAAGASNLDWME